ncbi:guanine nucleotide-binding protein subunit alpha-12-like [Misgurnus anguillicaudatus]|uniref:guanine nucleotide-binding protein subunit alpha-12-like n=1 Tax=Misgurnus anguillicaudatus TaxID=75329 RepID=UPI003CCF2E91
MSKRLSWSFLPTVSDLKQKRAARRRSHEIDVMLKRTSQVPVKILLMGESQSGVSTFLKQMRIINGPEFSQQELIDFRQSVYQNILKGLQLLVIEKNSMGIPWENSANETHKMLVMSIETWNMNLEPHTFQGFVTAINSLWNDSGIQEAYSKIKKMHFLVTYESVKYFLNNMNRIGQLSYIPCKQDILYAGNFCRASGNFVHRNILITEGCVTRKFDGCHNTTILFMVASSEFDQVMDDLYTSNGSTSLVEALKLFKAILCNRSLCKCTIILFLNKTDLLAEKVQTADIRKYFPEFQGDPHSLEDVQRFLVECFRERITTVDDSRPFFHHFTTAVDTENIRLAFDSVKEIIMQKNLKKLKIL